MEIERDGEAVTLVLSTGAWHDHRGRVHDQEAAVCRHPVHFAEDIAEKVQIKLI